MSALPVIVLDRDGVINQDSSHYIKSPDEFVLIPGSAEAIGRLSRAGFRVGIATNQSGIARGLYDEKTLGAIHEKMKQHVALEGGVIDEIAFCPHHPDMLCACRKPQPGLLLELAQRFQVKPQSMIFIGDKLTDVEAAIAVGCRAMLVLSPMTDQCLLAKYPSLSIYPSLAACVNALFQEWAIDA